MYCKKCGAQLDENAKFCYDCGTSTTENTPAGKPTPQPPVPPKKAPRKKKGLIAAVAILGVIAVAVAALAFSGLLGNDSVKVAAALAKSGKAFADAGNQLGLTDLSSLEESQQFNEEFAFWIDEIAGSSSLSGLGLRLNMDSDLPGRNADIILTPFWGSADLLSIQMKLNESEIYLGSPEMTGGTFYMINTETFCKDLQNLGIDMGEAATISFNIFDVIEKAQELYAGNEELAKAIKEAGTALLAELEVEKTGSETIDVNGAQLDCTAYGVMIPETAMRTFLNAIEEAYTNAQNPDAYGQLLEAMGAPADVIAEMKATMEDPAYTIHESFTLIYEALEEVGDIHLKLYLNDGYVVSVVYEEIIDGVSGMMVLNIGGGDNYVDNLSFRLIADEEEYRITSTGNHAGTNDVFTDVTVLEYVYGGETTTLVQLNTSYAPKQTEDNFNFALEADYVAMDFSGQLTCEKDSMGLYLDKIAVSEYGETLAVIGMEFSIGAYKGDSITVKDYQAFADMSENDLMVAAEEIVGYASDWLRNLDTSVLSKMMEIASAYGVF